MKWFQPVHIEKKKNGCRIMPGISVTVESFAKCPTPSFRFPGA